MSDGHREFINASERERLRIDVRGIVQGVGFRPFVFRLASDLGLWGWVRNDAHGVIIEVEGPSQDVRGFTDALSKQAPPLATLDEVRVTSVPLTGARAFVIQPSDIERDGCVPISPDIATCDDCLRELFDPADRRHRYPFTNCTNCGPRLTIVEGVPYDRPRTTMKKFPLCPRCRAEYANPRDRRFHAQPNACPVCGPKPWLRPASGLEGQFVEGELAIMEARRLLVGGAILAMKGLGGFHLACDATNARSVATLRTRKGRVDKPFALMVRDLEAARRLCHVDDKEASLLTSPRRPIVLLTRREESPVVPDVAPGLRRLGVMLPHTPLHHLILEQRGVDDCVALVMTSGNLSEEPIAIDNDEALDRLEKLADHFLLHDRDIGVRCDDSVAVVLDGRSAVIRRSRGYAPFPVHLPFDVRPTLSCGGELKSTFCLATDRYAFLSQHIGDLENAETLESFEQGVERYRELFRLTPRVVAYDLHPDYLASRYARQLGQRDSSLRLVPVQHHHAHMASCMAENGLSGPMIGVIWDGTGYGPDGAVWGGEFLVGDYRDVERVAHLSYVPMPGGDVSTRRPSRMTLSYLRQSFGPDYLGVVGELLPRLDAVEVGVVDRLLATGFNSPLTSSAGRLFDAVAALLGVRDTVTYEGQAAIELEMLAHEDEAGCYPFALEAPLPSHPPEPESLFSHSEPFSRHPGPLFCHPGPFSPHPGPLFCHSEPQRRISPLVVPEEASPQVGTPSSLQQGDPSLRLRMTGQRTGEESMTGQSSADESVTGRKPGDESMRGQRTDAESLSDPTDRSDQSDRSDACQLIGHCPLVLDMAPTIRAIVEEMRRSVDRATIAARFHNTLAGAIEQVCMRVHERTGLERVVLSGGVFQNRLLLHRTLAGLRARGFQVFIQTAVPCNDGGLSLGQVVVAHARTAEH